MKLKARHRWTIIGCILVLAAVTAWFEPTGVVRGRLRGEAFYEGRPTNYWSRELSRWGYSEFFIMGEFAGTFDNNLGLVIAGNEAHIDHNPEQEMVEVEDIAAKPSLHFANLWGNATTFDGTGWYSRTPGIADKVAGWLGVTLDADEPAILSGAGSAEAVLRELLDDPNPTVRAHARRTLGKFVHVP